jgi:MoxR-like ATPase
VSEQPRNPDQEARSVDQKAQMFNKAFEQLLQNIETVIIGKTEPVKLALVCLFAEGHLLLEDVPGTGKTSLAKAIASSIDGKWARVQFTPDLLPADITGATIYNQSTGIFEFRQGPVFANIVLGDEINRASPKTQSALLEVMEENQITVDSHSYVVPRPFMVIATQNPIEFHGTYPLPEAQLDRFLMRISLGHLDFQSEVEVLGRHGQAGSGVNISPVMSSSTVRAMVQMAEKIHVEPAIQNYIVSIAHATRELADVQLGASTRACLALQKAARVSAAADGRSYVRTDDVKRLAGPVLEHRLVLRPDAEMRGTTRTDLVQRVLREVTPPAVRRTA